MGLLTGSAIPPRAGAGAFPAVAIARVVVAGAVVLTGCQAIRLPRPVRAVEGEWGIAGGGAGRNPVTERTLAPPLRAAWNYSANGGFGPGGAVVVAGTLLVGNRKGEVHAVRLENGRKVGVADFKNPVEGSPAVAGDRMFVPLAWGGRSIVGYDLASGARRWSARWKPVDASPIVVGDALVAAAADGDIRGFDLTGGAARWTVKSAGGGHSAGLAATDRGWVIAADERGTVRAIDSRDGSVAWTARVGAPVYETPTWHAGDLFVPTTRGVLALLDAATGRERWRLDLSAPTVRFTPATAAERLVYVGASDGFVRALDPTTGVVAWETELDDGISCQPLVAGRVVWVGTMGRALVALDAGSGAVLWSEEMPGRVKSTMLVHRGGLVVLSEPRNVIYLVPREASDDDG